jgi:isoleucyl-tRNA synthetase
MYRPVPSQVDLPAMEHEILAFWREHDIFAASLEQTRSGEPWTFYEGPPTANGLPGTHHVEARVFKDVFPRFQTMKGRHVLRRAGWDCHGLPVELAVERELGFRGKQDIEAYGIAEFNRRCRESVERHVGAFEEMTERMGFWVDMSQAYRTMDRSYVESVWWSIQQIHAKGLLVQDHRVAPYCPRCGTGLSDHELAQGYETVVDPSVFVRLPVTGGPLANLGAALLVWTTTPWTLVANTAVAVHPEVTYVAARTPDGEVLVVAEPLLRTVLGGDLEILVRYSGRDLELTPYRPPFDLVDVPDAHVVVLADYVTVADGTGLVHQSPAFGADDLAVARRYGLAVVNPITADGHFADDVPLVGGMFFKKADAALVDDLQARGLLFRHVPYEHPYPHCWRCHTPLLYYAQPSWYIRTTAIKDRLLEENARTNWFPPTIRTGRYGDWLAHNVDWALSRTRYWGTPLPVWRCEQEHVTVVGSLAELGQLAARDLSGLDPHRPYVDEVTLACPTCGGQARRVPEVMDSWYDSGAMPFAQWGYPHTGRTDFEAAYPAQFICEAIDQTRGWFYTLMAVGTLVFDRSSYENVVCLGHILDEAGRKMSKNLGNVLEPIPLMDRHGADAVRWFMAAGGSPWQARRVGHTIIQEVVRKTLLTYWNTASFLSLYGRAAGWEPATQPAPAPAQRSVLDRWALSEANRLAADVDAALEQYDTQQAGRLVAAYVDDLSNWYVRRSRRRFWAGDPAALSTLHECLRVVTLLMAPLTPFITEQVWQDMFAGEPGSQPRSVHLAAWPTVDPSLIDDDLAAQMALVRRLVELGRATRAGSAVKTRQPLARALVAAPAWEQLPAELVSQMAEELNVARVDPLHASDELVAVTAKANFRALGRRFGQRTPAVASAVAAADARRLADDLREHGAATVSVDGQPVALTTDEVVVTEVPREGWAVASEGGETLALDLSLTPQLRRAGLARDVVRLVQDARKRAGLDVSDRIRLVWAADGELAVALREHADPIAEEVLAVSFAEGDPGGGDGPGPQTAMVATHDADSGLEFAFERVEG